MALKGEGDPRWVVRERQDGRNVNGWHWEDKEVTIWAKNRLMELITCTTCKSDTPAPGVHVVSLDSVDGDATLYNRKGVLKVLYDLKLSGKWSSRHEEEDNRTFGDFRVELFDEDPEVFCNIDSKAKSADNSYRQSFQKNVFPAIIQNCRLFICELQRGADQFVDGLSIQCGINSKPQTQSLRTSSSSRTHFSSSNAKSEIASNSRSTDDIHVEERFMCSSDEWLQVFTDVRRLSALTRGKAIVEAKPDGRWEVMDGAASGTFRSLGEKQSITLNWKLRSWGDEAKHATVTLSASEPVKGRTKAKILIVGHPKGTESETEGFWRIQILQAMRVLFGWGDAAKFFNM